jgi:two-component system KDP operon response regulator KdpE
MARRVVLVVEDEPLLRERVKVWLESEKFDVQCASEYSSAIKSMGHAAPAIACVDLTLPRESGLDLVEAIRKSTTFNHVPIIVMSDRHSPEDMAEAERVGANAFLKKPFAKPLLLKYVRWILDGPHASSPSIRGLRRVESTSR